MVLESTSSEGRPATPEPENAQYAINSTPNRYLKSLSGKLQYYKMKDRYTV
jgi:hypothetical protein